MNSDSPVDLYGLAASDFGPDFTWGVATAAYQIEGAWNIDGKGPSIWDTFCHRRRRPVPTILTGETGDVACDFYNRYESDLKIMGGLGVKANRFSVSWPRVLPDGVGRINQSGLDYYSRVVDATLANGMEPWLTLYHWDLPQSLHERGGWPQRDIVGWFEEYVGVMANHLGDRVKNWMVFNEPFSFCVSGYLLGAHAPGIINPRKHMAAVHHVNLCQAAAARILRSTVKDCSVGTTHVIGPVSSKSKSSMGSKARRSVDAIMHRIYIEPNLGMGYPISDNPIVRLVEKFIRPGDDESIKVDFDFIGAQYYSAFNAIPVPLIGGLPIPSRGIRGGERDQMGWWINPSGLYDAVNMLHSYGRFQSIIITENGTAVPDEIEDGKVYDLRRIDYLRRHIGQVTRARVDGIPVDGYFYWSFMDNFEWAFGYKPRFGLVHVDHQTQVRTIKNSGLWYKEFLAS